MNALVLGGTGMLGSAIFRCLSQATQLNVFATVRSMSSAQQLPNADSLNFIDGIDVENCDSLLRAISQSKPQIVINCVGLVKQLADANDPLQAVPINTMLPHRLAQMCSAIDARLIHISTDCVFSGNSGQYLESDHPDASDLYGRSKLLGEVDYPNAVTLRTSIIGHELSGQRSLLNWFLAQSGSVKGYENAFFSGVPTIELAEIIRDYVIPNEQLTEVYHVAEERISKHNLLREIAATYKKQISIEPDSQLIIDRSLNADRFNQATGYQAPSWPELIHKMYTFQ